VASDTDLEVGFVVDNKALVKGFKEAEKQGETTGKKLKDSGDKGGAAYDAMGKKVAKAALTFIGFQSVEAVIGRIIQQSPVLQSNIEGWAAVLGYMTEAIITNGRVEESRAAIKLQSEMKALRAEVAETSKQFMNMPANMKTANAQMEELFTNTGEFSTRLANLGIVWDETAATSTIFQSELDKTNEKLKNNLILKTLTAACKEYGLSLDLVGVFMDGLRRKQDLATDSEERYRRKIEETIKAQDEERKRLAELARKDSWDGFNDGVREALEGMQDMEAVGKEVADGIRTSFADTFKDVVKGTFDARTALSSVLDMLLNVFANLASGQLTAGIGGALGFGGAKAGGGPVSAGTAYLVGEDGPEIFRAPGNGTIVPAGETARMLSGSASVHAPITINIHESQNARATAEETGRQVRAVLLDIVSRDQAVRRAIGNS